MGGRTIHSWAIRERGSADPLLNVNARSRRKFTIGRLIGGIERYASEDTQRGPRDEHAKLAQLGRTILAIGRASCRARVCHYVYISVFALSLKKNLTSVSRLPQIFTYFTT